MHRPWLPLVSVAKVAQQVPHWQVLVQFALAAESNARELINDAEVLLAAGRWPRAYALAVLAHEEFGKGLMAIALVAAHPAARKPERLRELTGGHIRKLISTSQHEAMVGGPEWQAELLGSPKLARVVNERKQRGFYVDFADDGSLRLPSEIGEGEAKAQVASVRATVYSPGLRSAPFWL
jgi:AbiV family abortive infection protein